MARYTEYVVPASLEEAWTLNQKKSAVIVAGNMWLRMCGLRKKTAIDLSGLGLGEIEDCGDTIRIGAMVTLRQTEESALLKEAFGGVFADALSPIVGTQFRNTATVGGSVFSRFGFSDVSALLLAMNASVVLYKRGEIPLAQFHQEAPDRDILTHIVIPKGQKAGVSSVRINSTDFPVLVSAVSVSGAGASARVVLGSRPARAVVVAEDVSPEIDDKALAAMAADVPMGGNLRAGEAYRRKIAPVLMRRALDAAKEAGK